MNDQAISAREASMLTEQLEVQPKEHSNLSKWRTSWNEAHDGHPNGSEGVQGDENA